MNPDSGAAVMLTMGPALIGVAAVAGLSLLVGVATRTPAPTPPTWEHRRHLLQQLRIAESPYLACAPVLYLVSEAALAMGLAFTAFAWFTTYYTHFVAVAAAGAAFFIGFGLPQALARRINFRRAARHLARFDEKYPHLNVPEPDEREAEPYHGDPCDDDGGYPTIVLVTPRVPSIWMPPPHSASVHPKSGRVLM